MRRRMNHLRSIKKAMAISMPIVLALVIVLSTSGSAMGQENSAAPGKNASTAASRQEGPTDRAEMEAFLDEELGREMEKHHIAGAAVSVVKDGKLFFAKGYGSADLENKTPVDPEQTVFRIGSVGKLFTWTAVMQLAEQGKLDLDEDINAYLDFRIPDTYPQPITLKDLMTHTSGFEDRLRGSVVSDPNDVVPTREWLISHMPARVRPPGDIAGYSNYNAMLAGYIVARVSGEPYHQYIQEHILNPLGMVHSTAQSPIPQDLRAHASVGYTYKDGAFHVFPDYAVQPAALPSGAHQASVTDMARFMIAHLQNGRYGDANTAGVRILKKTTAQQMHSTLYTPDPRLLGTAYGFFDFSDNGQRTLGHVGYSPPMYSLLLLLSEQNLGVYVAYNSEGGGDLTNQHLGFQRAFFDHYYPAPAVESIQPPADFAERASRFEGMYSPTAGSYTTLDKVGKLFGAVEISDPGNGTLLFTIAGSEWRFVEVEPLNFRQVDGPDGPFNMALLLGCVLMFLSMIPVVLIRFIRNRRLSSDRIPASRGARVAYWIIVGISVLNLLFVVGTVKWGNQPNVLSGTSMIYKIVLGVGVLSAVLTVGALLYSVVAWKNSYWGIAARVHYTLVTVAAVAFVWFLNYWNLLGWRF